MITNSKIDGGTPYDWSMASHAYAEYRDIYPDVFYDKIHELGIAHKGRHVLDIGTGTGVLPRNLCKYGASFVGIDIAENQIAEARRMSAPFGDAIKYEVANAEEMNFDAGRFDAVMACQCMQYFDISKLIPKIKLVLKQGGLFGIFFMAWLPSESGIAAQSEKLVRQYSPTWDGYGWWRKPAALPSWAKEYGFNLSAKCQFDIMLPFTREAWNGRMVACRGIGAKLKADKVQEFEEQHLNMLHQIAPKNFEIPHWVTMLVLKSK